MSLEQCPWNKPSMKKSIFEGICFEGYEQDETIFTLEDDASVDKEPLSDQEQQGGRQEI